MGVFEEQIQKKDGFVEFDDEDIWRKMFCVQQFLGVSLERYISKIEVD